MLNPPPHRVDSWKKSGSETIESNQTEQRLISNQSRFKLPSRARLVDPPSRKNRKLLPPSCWYFYHTWLVLWKMNYFSIHWECHDPNWRSHIFQKGRLNPPTRYCLSIFMDQGCGSRMRIMVVTEKPQAGSTGIGSLCISIDRRRAARWSKWRCSPCPSYTSTVCFYSLGFQLPKIISTTRTISPAYFLFTSLQSLSIL